MPRPTQLGCVGGLAFKGKLRYFLGGVPAGARCGLENRPWPEAWVLGACSPGQVTKRLHALVARDHIDPVPNLQTPDQREDLVRGEVEGMKGQPELFMTLERKEAE